MPACQVEKGDFGRAAPIGTVLAEATMSLSLPPEILDLIVDHLHDEPTALRACCLVSKSWIPRTRIHLFDRVEFRLTGSYLESWMEAFPDPSNSPAHYVRILHLTHFKIVTVAISDALPWVHSFNNIVDLRVVTVGQHDYHVSFAQFRGISPTLKSLRLFYSFAPLSEVLDLICSFPLLEDLSLCSVQQPYTKENADEWNDTSTSPKLTGSLLLSGSNRNITRKLLDLPGGLRFSKIRVFCAIGGSDLAKELVSVCSDTLESLCVEFYRGASSTSSVADQYLIASRRCALACGAAIT